MTAQTTALFNFAIAKEQITLIKSLTDGNLQYACRKLQKLNT